MGAYFKEYIACDNLFIDDIKCMYDVFYLRCRKINLLKIFHCFYHIDADEIKFELKNKYK